MAQQTRSTRPRSTRSWASAVGELGATLNAALVVIGDKLGLYKAMAGAGPLTPRELAERTGTNERYVREWLNAQAAGGYVDLRRTAATRCPPSTPSRSPTRTARRSCPARSSSMTAAVRDEPKITEAFRSGAGVGWHEHNHGLFEGSERFFRPGYARNLVPVLDSGARRRRGEAARGRARRRRRLRPRRLDDHHGRGVPGLRRSSASTTTARRSRRRASARRGRRGDASASRSPRAQDFPGAGYDLVTTFDCLHDMGDPVGAARHVREALAADGTWLIVEPFAGDRVEDNLNPVGRVFYAASTMICTPASLSQEVGLALGAQAGEARLRDVVTAAGFTRFRRVAETPFNLVLEARP